MKKVLVAALLLSVLILSGCSSTSTKPYFYFAGHTKHWDIQIKVVNSQGSQRQDETVTFKYTGNVSDLKKVNQLKISYDTTATGGSETLNRTHGFTKTQFQINGSGTGAKITTKSHPKATMQWGDQKESTQLVLSSSR